MDCFGQLVLFDNVRFVGADQADDKNEYWYSDLYISGANNTLPVEIRDCQFDSKWARWNVNLSDDNVRKIIVDNPIVLTNATHGFTNHAEMIQTPQYATYTN